MAQYNGFLFGCYDSRGGATFIEAPSEYEARLAYIAMGVLTYEETMKDAESWAFDPEASGFWKELNDARHDKQKAVGVLTESDFLGKATLRSDEEIPEGTDMEEPEHYEEEQEERYCLWVKEENAEYELFYSKKPIKQGPEGYKPSELGEDAFGCIFTKHTNPNAL